MAEKKMTVKELQEQLTSKGVKFPAKAKAEELVKLLNEANAAAAPAAGASAPAAPSVPLSPEEEAAKKLEDEIDAATKAPAGVKTEARAKEPVAGLEVVEGEDGIRRLNRRPGRFVSVDNEIFNENGVLCGTEVNSADAARKADRFNSQRGFRG